MRKGCYMKRIIQTMAMCVAVILSAKLGRVSFPDGRTETFYDLPMHKIVQQATEKNIPGEFWIREDGAKMYGDFVIVAANFKTHPYGSIVETSLGPGIVLDTGDFAKKEPYTIDIATDWKKGDNI